MAVATLIHDTQLVAGSESTDNGVRLTLGDGRRVCLDAGHPDFGRWMRHVGSPFLASYPLGVVTDEAGGVVDLSTARDTAVYWVRESSGGFTVGCWAFAPVLGLTREHPEFDRIHATLIAAAGTRQRLWVTFHDVENVDCGRDEDGLLFALPKVMDVRPV